MPAIRYRSAILEQGSSRIHVRLECPYYSEFLLENGGCFPNSFEVMALWDYYGAALIAHDRAKRNIVMEDELSLVFDVEMARNLFKGIANKHGVNPADMVNYWPFIMRQQWAMGGMDHLPDWAKFHYWGH